MDRRKIILISISCVLVIFAVIFLFLRPAYVSISMDGVQTKADGTVMLDRKIALKGWHFRPLVGQETFKATKIHIDGFHYSMPKQAPSPVFPDMDNANFAGCILLNQANKPICCDIMWADNGEFCLIHVDGYFFVCAENSDHQAILDLYSGVYSVEN